MRIKDISVENYRNLNSATITFDESCNFIVGENNLGKSNILNLLNIIFTRRGFVYDDFNDANLPITVILIKYEKYILTMIPYLLKLF